MQASISYSSNEAFYEPAKAVEMAAALQAHDDNDGWVYKAIPVSAKWSKIEILDEEGQHVAFWSM